MMSVHTTWLVDEFISDPTAQKINLTSQFGVKVLTKGRELVTGGDLLPPLDEAEHLNQHHIFTCCINHKGIRSSAV